jgi:hypothetical protein
MSCCSSPDDPAASGGGTGTPGGGGTGTGGTGGTGGGGTSPEEQGAAGEPERDPPAPVPDPEPVAPCVHCEITSETVMTQPANRARTDIGVGERVNVTFSLGEATWSLAGDGFLSSTSGATIVYRAPSRAQSVTLTATGSGCTATITFNIIAPTGVRMERIDVLHQQNKPNIGMHTKIYILPDTVNFHQIQIKELDVNGVASGIYSCKSGVGHSPGPDPTDLLTTVRAGFGTRVDGDDTVFSGYCAASPNAGVGSSSWAIPWHYALRGGTFRKFTTVNQVHTCDVAGALRASKARAVATASIGDATSGSVNGTPL